MTISIIVPVFNIPELPLRQCIESIKNQSYKNFELLLINDGSTNNCECICKEYCIDDRIQLINKENGGVSSARNIGLEKSTGDYIMFVDADDMLTSKALEVMANAVTKTEADIMICDYKRFVSYSRQLEVNKKSDNVCLFENKEDLIKLRKKCLHEDKELNIRINGAPWGKLYSSKILKNKKLLFDTSLVRSQDNHFNFRLFRYVKKVGYINLPLYLYRYMPSSSVNKFRSNLFEISQRYIQKIEDIIKIEHSSRDFEDTIKSIKIEKFSEYISTNFTHPQNKTALKDKIKRLKEIKNIWFADESYKEILKNLESYRSKLLYKFIFNDQYKLAYYYMKQLKGIKSILLKFR